MRKVIIGTGVLLLTVFVAFPLIFGFKAIVDDILKLF